MNINHIQKELQVKKIEPIYLMYQEKLIEQSDMGHNAISNECAQRVLAQYYHIPKIFWQPLVINRMVKLDLLKRDGKRLLIIKSDYDFEIL